MGISQGWEEAVMKVSLTKDFVQLSSGPSIPASSGRGL